MEKVLISDQGYREWLDSIREQYKEKLIYYAIIDGKLQVVCAGDTIAELNYNAMQLPYEIEDKIDAYNIHCGFQTKPVSKNIEDFWRKKIWKYLKKDRKEMKKRRRLKFSKIQSRFKMLGSRHNDTPAKLFEYQIHTIMYNLLDNLFTFESGERNPSVKKEYLEFSSQLERLNNLLKRYIKTLELYTKRESCDE